MYFSERRYHCFYDTILLCFLSWRMQMSYRVCLALRNYYKREKKATRVQVDDCVVFFFLFLSTCHSKGPCW